MYMCMCMHVKYVTDSIMYLLTLYMYMYMHVLVAECDKREKGRVTFIATCVDILYGIVMQMLLLKSL